VHATLNLIALIVFSKEGKLWNPNGSDNGVQLSESLDLWTLSIARMMNKVHKPSDSDGIYGTPHHVVFWILEVFSLSPNVHS
jgi:hypothetical protein